MTLHFGCFVPQARIHGYACLFVRVAAEMLACRIAVRLESLTYD